MVFEETDAARRQVEQGPRAGLRRPDLRRRRGALPEDHKPELGITDPYALDRDQFKAALDLLRQQRKLVGRYWHDAIVQMDDFKNEGVVGLQLVAVPGQPAARPRSTPIASVIPEEGATGWADTTMMHADAPHPNCAYMWLEHSLNPQAPGRPGGLVRLGAGGAGGLQGQRAARRQGLRDQRLRQLRQDRLLADAGGRLRQWQDGLRAVPRVGDAATSR